MYRTPFIQNNSNKKGLNFFGADITKWLKQPLYYESFDLQQYANFFVMKKFII